MAAHCDTFRAEPAGLAPLCFQLGQICWVSRLKISYNGERESLAFKVYAPGLAADIVIFNEIYNVSFLPLSSPLKDKYVN